MKEIYDFLENYISQNGYEGLSEDALHIYNSMTEAGIHEDKARLILVTLMSGCYKHAISKSSIDDLTEHIQQHHYLLKRTATSLAKLYTNLLNPETLKSLQDHSGQGFDEFCESVWTMEWKGSCDWHAKNYTVLPCRGELSIEFEVSDVEKLKQHLEPQLKKNPFMTEDDVYEVLTSEFSNILNSDLYDYCNADDYYEPYMEEFPSEGTYEFDKKCKEWGIEIVDISGGGEVLY